MIAFFGIFAVAGGIFLWLLLISPLLSMWAADSWAETPCTILSSGVGVHRGEDSDTYSVDITYAYEFQGQSYESDRYDFSFGSSSGRKSKQEAVDRYPTGSSQVCFVDSENPSEACLNREPGSDLWWGLFSVPFLAVGLGGIFFMLRSSSSSRPSVARPGRWRAIEPERTLTGELRLQTETSAKAAVIVLGVVTVFWNGIVASVWLVADDGGFSWFLVPFMLVGLGIFAAFVYTLLASFNPKPELTLNTTRPTPGAEVEMRWRIHGSTDRLEFLRFSLIGTEKATYRRGTKTHTDTHEFYFQEVRRLENSWEMADGTARVMIPAGTMPTFRADSNTVLWTLKVEGSIPRWPDLRVEFLFPVYPKTGESA